MSRLKVGEVERPHTWHAGDRLLTADERIAATPPVARTWWTP